MSVHKQLYELCTTQDARHLIKCVWNFVEVWDDAIDGEKNQSDVSINHAFNWALFEAPNDPFLRQHPALWLSMQEAIALWTTANQLEKTGRIEDLRQSFVLRCSPYNFFVSIVGLDSGPEAAIEAATLLYGGPTDDFDRYVQEHKGAQ